MEKYEYAQYTFKALILVQMKTSQLTQCTQQCGI